MASIKFMLEAERGTGRLLNVLDKNGTPAVVNNKERRKNKHSDIIVSAAETASPSRGDCPNGYYKLTINNNEYCIPI